MGNSISNVLKSLSLLLSCWLLNGCAINSTGFAPFFKSDTRVYEGATVQQIRSTGIYIYTKGGIGMQIGSIERELVFPVASEDASFCIQQAMNGAVGLESRTQHIDDPVRIRSLRAGLGLDVSHSSLNINIGMLHRNATKIQADRSMIFWFQNKDKTPEACALIENIKTDT